MDSEIGEPLIKRANGRTSSHTFGYEKVKGMGLIGWFWHRVQWIRIWQNVTKHKKFQSRWASRRRSWRIWWIGGVLATMTCVAGSAAHNAGSQIEWSFSNKDLWWIPLSLIFSAVGFMDGQARGRIWIDVGLVVLLLACTYCGVGAIQPLFPDETCSWLHCKVEYFAVLAMANGLIVIVWMALLGVHTTALIVWAVLFSGVLSNFWYAALLFLFLAGLLIYNAIRTECDVALHGAAMERVLEHATNGHCYLETEYHPNGTRSLVITQPSTQMNKLFGVDSSPGEPSPLEGMYFEHLLSDNRVSSSRRESHANRIIDSAQTALDQFMADDLDEQKSNVTLTLFYEQTELEVQICACAVARDSILCVFKLKGEKRYRESARVDPRLSMDGENQQLAQRQNSGARKKPILLSQHTKYIIQGSDGKVVTIKPQSEDEIKANLKEEAKQSFQKVEASDQKQDGIEAYFSTLEFAWEVMSKARGGSMIVVLGTALKEDLKTRTVDGGIMTEILTDAERGGGRDILENGEDDNKDRTFVSDWLVQLAAHTDTDRWPDQDNSIDPRLWCQPKDGGTVLLKGGQVCGVCLQFLHVSDEWRFNSKGTRHGAGLAVAEWMAKKQSEGAFDKWMQAKKKEGAYGGAAYGGDCHGVVLIRSESNSVTVISSRALSEENGTVWELRGGFNRSWVAAQRTSH